MEIYKELIFEANHQLPKLPEDQQDGRLHGDSFKGHLYASAQVAAGTCWIEDFSEIKAISKPICVQPDHHYSNDIPSLENTTCGSIYRGEDS
ncbi:MAG: 6-carboxytetrahydropterin synthase [Gammaproteobacteria bacterium]|nr:6-carboxytetrahydropterin synthase [Gammaproteobacteria bacterium]